MQPITRREVLAATSMMASVPSLNDSSGAQEPRELGGTIVSGKIYLPPLHNESEVESSLPSPEPTNKRLGVAVVGLGHLALGQILPAFSSASHVKLAALVSGSPEKARLVAARYDVPSKNIYTYQSFDQLKNNSDVDIVYVVLPNSLHAEFTIRAAQAGKDVLCEKPMAVSSIECKQMISACRSARKQLMIAYRMQYNEQHRDLIKMVRGKQFGEVRLLSASNTQNDAANGQWRQIKALAGGGSLPDVGLYCLNAFRYLTGEEPEEVSGRITRPSRDPRFREIEDVCSFDLRFPSGIVASGLSSYSCHENRQLKVMAADAWFGADPAFGYDGVTLQIGRKKNQSNSWEERRFAPKNQFAVEMDNFAERLRRNIPPYTPGEEGLQDQLLMEAIYNSASNGGGAVKVDSTHGLDSTRGEWREFAD